MESLTFPQNSLPGQQQCFDIQQYIVNDIIVEYPENFMIMVSSSDTLAQFSPGRDCATVNIDDNDRKFLLIVHVEVSFIPQK